MLTRLFRSLFRRRMPARRETGVVSYQSPEKKLAWVYPHNYPAIVQVNARVLRRSGFLWQRLQPGDRVEWDASEGLKPRTLYLYRRAPGR